MSIVIGCDSFLSLRNVRNGDLGRRLREATGERVVVLADPAQREGAVTVAPPGVELDALEPFDPYRDPDLQPAMYRSYMTRKSWADPATLWTKMRASIVSGHPPGARRLAALLRARSSILWYGLAGRMGRAPGRRRAFAELLRRHPTAEAYRRRIEAWDASLVVAFSLEGPREMVLLEAASSVGIPTAVMVRSRDNLAAKIQHLPDAAAYLVWSDLTKRGLVRMYPEVPAERVHVTGSPQFDRHLDPAWRLSRAELFARIGLDPERPLVVYTCATPTLIRHEIDIVQHLADAVAGGKLRKGGTPAQLLVRQHPRGFGSDHAVLRESRPGVAVYPPPGPAPYLSPEHEREVVRLILEDEPVHLATLAWQDVQVNVSGTMTVDSSILDKPVVNVYYDLPPDVPAGVSVRRFYRRSDYRPIVASGGVRLAHDPEECLRWINRYLEEPTLDADGRRWIRETDCGPLDGRAGERIAGVLADLCPPIPVASAAGGR